MALSITELFDQGTGLTIDNRGPVLIRTYLVEGLDTSLSVAARLRQAALGDASGIRIPRYGEGVDGLIGVYALEIKSDFFPNGSRESAIVRVTYSSPEHQQGTPGTFVFSCDAATSEVPVARDVDGTPLKVSYTDPNTSGVAEQTVRISVLRPRPIVTWQTISNILNPLALTLAYSGKVNSNQWQGGDERTWLCRGVSFDRLGAQQADGSIWWRISYEFQYDELTWDQFYYYRDPQTGRIPTDADTSDDNSKGIFTYKPDETDFNGLGIPTINF